MLDCFFFFEGCPLVLYVVLVPIHAPSWATVPMLVYYVVPSAPPLYSANTGDSYVIYAVSFLTYYASSGFSTFHYTVASGIVVNISLKMFSFVVDYRLGTD